jgi:integrase
LTWEDIDFDRLTVTVQASYAKNGERRSIPMNDLLHRSLEEVRIKSPGPVFPNRKGTQYRNFRTPFNNAVKKAGISDFTFHDLRHTFASRLVMSGIDLPTVKELMGHKDITMTLRYTHLSSDHKQNAVKALDNFGTNLRRFSRQGENDTDNGSPK